MFGRRFFGVAFFGPRYWADGSSVPAVVPNLGIFPAHAWILVYNSQGLLERIVDVAELTMSREVNRQGVAECTIAYDETAIVNDILQSAYIEVWWEDAQFNIGPRFEFRGFVRRPRFRSERGFPQLDFLLIQDVSLLARKRIAWKAGISNRSDWPSSTPVETVAKEAVLYNFTAAAGADGTGVSGRLVGHSLSGGFQIVVEDDFGNGPQRPWGAAYQVVLEFLQRLATFSGHDFSLPMIGPLTWEFRWHPNLLGQNVSQAVVFSIEHDNMEDPLWEIDDTGAADVAIIAGGGDGSERVVLIRERDEVVYERELLVDTRDIDIDPDDPDPAAINRMLTRGDETLAESRARGLFTFRPLQVPATLYGVHYDFGDLVTGVNPFTNAASILQVNKISIRKGARGGLELSIDTKEV